MPMRYFSAMEKFLLKTLWFAIAIFLVKQNRYFIVPFLLGAFFCWLTTFILKHYIRPSSSPAVPYRPRPDYRLSGSYESLVLACKGMSTVADRLVSYEMALDRSLSPAQAAAAAYERLCRDRE